MDPGDPAGRRLTTAEAAHRLGVKPASLYAYVSRGLLTSLRTPRGSSFDAEQVERLARRGRSPRRPAGAVETVRSALTTLDGDRLRYRGHDAVELSRGSTVEAVARLLWTGDLVEGPFEVDEVAADQVRDVLAALPRVTRLTDRLRVALSARPP